MCVCVVHCTMWLFLVACSSIFTLNFATCAYFGTYDVCFTIMLSASLLVVEFALPDRVWGGGLNTPNQGRVVAWFIEVLLGAENLHSARQIRRLCDYDRAGSELPEIRPIDLIRQCVRTG